jgi:hypothetical protein
MTGEDRKTGRREGKSSCLHLLLVSSLAACHGSAARTAAEKGDLPAVRVQIAAGEQAASLHMPEVAALARATAEHEVAVATGDAAVARVEEVRACAPELEAVLEERRTKGDAAGAAAAMALLEAGLLGEGAARSYVGSADACFRAVGVRGLTRGRDEDARRKALVDPSPAVRRAALRAMGERPAALDLPAVFDVAREDPVPLVRTDAVRLMGLLANADDETGALGSNIARLLSDLYPTADDPLREDIGAAWAAPEVFAHGGREPLRLLLLSEQGGGALTAAAAVLREPRVVDPEVETAARATLFRAIESGARRHRLHAIAIVPLDRSSREKGGSSLVDALDKAATDDDLEVRVAALGRLASAAAPAAGRPDAVQRLEAIAARSEPPDLVSRARLCLAHAAVMQVQAWLEKDLTASDAWVRLSAVGGLVALGRATRAAPVLVDADVSVRTRGACSLLLAARLGSSPR